MVGLRHVATLAGGGDMPLATVTDLLLSGAGRLYTISRSGDGIRLFDIAGTGAPVLLGQAVLRSAAPVAGFAPGLAELTLSETTTLLMPAGFTGGASSTYQTTATGLSGTAVRWQTDALPPNDLALIRAIEDMAVPAAIAVGRDGRLMFLTVLDGRRPSVEILDIPLQTGGAVTAMDMIRLGADTLLVTASATGQSVVSYRIRPDFTLEQAALIEASSSGIGFAPPSALHTVRLGQESYVLLASAGSSSLTVFRLGAEGGLLATDHVLDSRDTRFHAVTVLETLTLGDRVFVLAAGADDGLSLLTLLPGGRLIHLTSLPDTATMTLGAISALAAGPGAGPDTGGGQIFVASAREPGLTRLALDHVPGVVREGISGVLTGTAQDDLLTAREGVTLIRGEAGNDVLVSPEGAGAAVRLEGGAGQDLFVIQPGARQVTLADYTPGTDRIDLTLFPMLRSLGQIQITPTANGAVLRIGDSVIEILTANGRTLPASHFTEAELLPLSRFAPPPPDPGPQGLNFALGNDGGSAGGSGADDILRGGAGNDTIRGEGGDDVIEGGTGNDDIGGGPGNDLIFGDEGSNMLWGGFGDDTVQGGTGADTIQGGGNGTNQLFGNDRDDLIFAGSGGDLIGGGAGNDTVRGGDGADTIYGGFGNDNIGGGAGNDAIFGSAGANTIWGGFGNDTVQGGAGNDVVYGGGDGTNQLFGNDGNDVLQAGAGGDFIGGGAGNDTVRGGDGADTIYGGFGNDNIGGGAGNDAIFGAAGANTIWGGFGNDTVQGGAGNDVIYGGGDGTNQLFGNDGSDFIQAGAGGDFIGGGAGNDTIRGGAGADTIYGGFGNDNIGGGAGNDAIFGAAGANVIWGGLGNDTVQGGAGNDTIHGGAGTDILSGGPGADTFVFASADQIGIGAARDAITDFQAGVDDIDLRALNTTFNGTGGLSGAGQASFFYFAAGGLLIGDQTGNGVADWVIELIGAPRLGPGDFLL